MTKPLDGKRSHIVTSFLLYTQYNITLCRWSMLFITFLSIIIGSYVLCVALRSIWLRSAIIGIDGQPDINKTVKPVLMMPCSIGMAYPWEVLARVNETKLAPHKKLAYAKQETPRHVSTWPDSSGKGGPPARPSQRLGSSPPHTGTSWFQTGPHSMTCKTTRPTRQMTNPEDQKRGRDNQRPAHTPINPMGNGST